MAALLQELQASKAGYSRLLSEAATLESETVGSLQQKEAEFVALQLGQAQKELAGFHASVASSRSAILGSRIIEGADLLIDLCSKWLDLMDSLGKM